MSFTFRQIEIFVEAAADGNFRKTADRLGISQPAVSKQIRALEKCVGKTLFKRTRGAAAMLSEDGDVMLANALEMLERQRLWKPAGASTAPLKLKVATGDYLLDRIVKPALSELVQRFPEVSIEFQIVNDPRLLPELLRSRQVDLALYTGSSPPPDVDGRVLAVIPCGLFAAPRLARELGKDRVAIARAPFILPAAPRARSWVIRAIEKAGINPSNVVAKVQFGDVMAQMVRDGLGVGLLFEDHAIGQFGSQIERLPVTIDPAHRSVIFGARAKLEAARPCVEFLCSLCTAPAVM